MAFIYTRSDLISRINAGIQGKIGLLISSEDTVNQAVRQVISDFDLRSTRRKATLTPKLFNGVFDYAAPTDLKNLALIDIPEQAKRSDGSFFLVPTEEFERQHDVGSIAVDDYNGIRVLKISSEIGDKTLVISELDSLTSGGGTWTTFGDATSLAADPDDFVKGNGSLKWNISAAGGTTAGIQNTSLTSFDLTDYLGGNGSAFIWHKINSATDITNYILRIGTDTSNYYSKTITVANDGTAFRSGWVLLRFDLSSLTTTGSPTNSTMRYVAVYMTKATGKISESDYKFDWLVLKRGGNADVKYYSKYGWQSSAGAYKENSTDDSDLLVADTDEYNLFIKKGQAVAADEADFPQGKIDSKEKEYRDALEMYISRNPSEAKIITSEYYRYE